VNRDESFTTDVLRDPCLAAEIGRDDETPRHCAKLAAEQPRLLVQNGHVMNAHGAVASTCLLTSAGAICGTEFPPFHLAGITALNRSSAR